MKFLKKAAALFFCLTLALSVMAITAAAEDTTTFSVKLDLVAPSLNDYDSDHMPEVAGDATLTYNIQLASNAASQNVNGVTFTVDVSGVTGATYTVALAGDFSGSVIAGVGANSHSFVMNTGSYITTSATADTFDTIGTLTVTLPGSIYDKQFTPALTSLSLAKNGVEAPFTPSYTAPTTVEVNPKYTITLTYKDTKNDGTIKAAESAPSGSPATLDYYYDNGTGTVSEGTFTPVNLPTPADITAYTNANQWTLGATVPSGTNGWTANETANAGSAIASGKIGNVTLEAVYTAIEYSYSVNYDNNSETASLGDTYTIENVATKLATLNATPTYKGYNFNQWASTAGTKTGNWDASFGTNVTLAGKYGDVSITATWTEMTFDINFKTYTPNANGVLEQTAAASEQSKTTYGYVSGLAANSIALPTKYNGYTCSGWKVTNIQGYTNTSGTEVAASGWTDGDTFDVTAAIPANRIGSITLEAVYTPISYTVTYVLDTDGQHNGHPGTEDATGTYTSNYTIVDVAGGADVFTLNTAPTRAGFSFVGWTAQGAANANEEKDTTYKTDKLNITESFTTAPSFAGAYGDVTFTAVWKAAGTGKAIEYAYAGKGNVLVLFAVENASSNVVGEYKYNGASMYRISDAAKYASEFTGFDSATGAIFAYITAADADGYNYANNITLDKGEGRNFQITYDGNVYNDSAVNAGDFGNVLNMLNAGNNDEFNLGMVSRLKADDSADETGEANNKYGSITDAKAIAAKVGSSVNPS